MMSPPPYPGYFWQGEKVCLRPLHVDDAEKKWREWTDSEARLLLEYGIDLPPVAPETYRRDLAEAVDFKDTSRFYSFAIDSMDGEFVGWLNLSTGDTRHGTFGYGVSVFREYQGHGYAEEALRLALRYMFFERRFQKCNVECLDINAASIRLHQKLGFKEEGRVRRSVYARGTFHDRVLFGLLKEEFEANDAAYRTRA